MRLSHKPCCGLLQANYYLPLRSAPLQLEFTSVQDESEPIIVPQGTGAGNEADQQGYCFTAGNASTQFEINNLVLRSELVVLDNTVAKDFSNHILGDGSLK